MMNTCFFSQEIWERKKRIYENIINHARKMKEENEQEEEIRDFLAFCRVDVQRMMANLGASNEEIS